MSDKRLSTNELVDDLISAYASRFFNLGQSGWSQLMDSTIKSRDSIIARLRAADELVAAVEDTRSLVGDMSNESIRAKLRKAISNYEEE